MLVLNVTVFFDTSTLYCFSRTEPSRFTKSDKYASLYKTTMTKKTLYAPLLMA